MASTQKRIYTTRLSKQLEEAANKLVSSGRAQYTIPNPSEPNKPKYVHAKKKPTMIKYNQSTKIQNTI